MSEDHDLRGPLLAGAQSLAVALDAEQCDRILGHVQLLRHWNRAFNLVAAGTLASLLETHVLDSLSALGHLRGAHAVDIGTGAGFPGLPLAIAAPERHWTLIDSNGKKVRFCRHVVATLGLSGVTVVHERAERFPVPTPASTVVARAVCTVAELVTLALPLLAPGGRVVAMKGRLPEAELQDPALAGLDLMVHRVAVPGLDAERHIVTVDGAAATAARGRATQ